MTRAFCSFGVRFRLEMDDRRTFEQLLACLPPLTALHRRAPVRCVFRLTHRQASDQIAWSVDADGQCVYRGPDRLLAFHLLDSAIRLFVATETREVVFVHAGVVLKDDVALVLPGPSGAGKTTLVAALIERGAAYYSDEYAVIHPSGHVLPFPRPLSFRTRDGRRYQPCPPPRAERTPVAFIVSTAFDQSGGDAEFTAISPGHAVLTLLRHAVRARRDPAVVLSTLSKCAGRASSFHGVRGEADVCAVRLLTMMRACRPQQSWQTCSPGDSHEPSRSSH